MFGLFKTLNIKNLSNKYKQDSINYIKQVNDDIAFGNKTKWETKSKGDELEDNRPEYAEQIFKVLLQINKTDKQKS
jgi:hypothetical protein